MCKLADPFSRRLTHLFLFLFVLFDFSLHVFSMSSAFLIFLNSNFLYFHFPQPKRSCFCETFFFFLNKFLSFWLCCFTWQGLFLSFPTHFSHFNAQMVKSQQNRKSKKDTILCFFYIVCNFTKTQCLNWYYYTVLLLFQQRKLLMVGRIDHSFLHFFIHSFCFVCDEPWDTIEKTCHHWDKASPKKYTVFICVLAAVGQFIKGHDLGKWIYCTSLTQSFCRIIIIALQSLSLLLLIQNAALKKTDRGLVKCFHRIFRTVVIIYLLQQFWDLIRALKAYRQLVWNSS